MGKLCGEGDVISSTFSCPYEHLPVYKSILSLWIIIWVSFFIFQLTFSSSYRTDDLRYYIQLEKLKQSIVSQVFFVVVFLFTLASMVTSFYYTKKNFDSGVTNSNTFMNQSFSTLLFGWVNMSAIVSYIFSQYPSLRSVPMSIFPCAIPLKKLILPEPSYKNLYGSIATSDTVLRTAERIYFKSLKDGNGATKEISFSIGFVRQNICAESSWRESHGAEVIE